MSNSERGRQLVEMTGSYQQPTMTDSLDVIAWIQQNREQVQENGMCGAQCVVQLIKHSTTGKLVCPMTYEPCLKRQVE